MKQEYGVAFDKTHPGTGPFDHVATQRQQQGDY